MQHLEPIHSIETITELNRFLHQGKPRHPLVSVIDFSAAATYGQDEGKFMAGFYTVMFKNHCTNKLKYGREYYDFQEGTLLCVAPNQVLTLEKTEVPKGEALGWGLFFHPDLVRGTSLGQKLKQYTFFSYETNEALHLSDKEKETLLQILRKLEVELAENIDQHSQTLIVSNIELLLNYCARFYGRQFITRRRVNTDLLSQFERLLTTYFQAGKIERLPTVKYCADQLALSPNYLSDLLKKETGKNAQEQIHYYLVEQAKNRLLTSTDSISQVAFSLGFEYPQYFSKLFKTKTGLTPAEFRNLP